MLTSRNIFKHITVELCFFFFCVSNEIIKFLNSNLYLQKSCRFNQTTEPDLDTKCDDEERGILFVSEISSKYYPINFFFSHLFTIFITCWSDEAGKRRRPLILVPLLAQITEASLNCLHSYYWNWKPMAAVACEMFLECFSGGMCLITYACQMYLCDITDFDNRTMRLGILGAIKQICILFGKGGSGFILRSFGFFYSYLICLILSSCGFISIWIFVKDLSIPVVERRSICKSFNFNRILDSFRIVFKKSLGKKRIIVVLLLITNVSAYFTTSGEFAVLYLYLRYRFQWDERKYSGFMLYKFTAALMGTLFCSIVLSKRLKMHDGLIGAIAGCMDVLAVVALLFASQSWHIYLTAILDIFHGTAMTICTSFMSKYYTSNEFGRLGAIYNVVSLISPFCYPTYNVIFQKTLETFPSGFCLVSAAVDVMVVVLYVIAYYLSKRFDDQKSTVVRKKQLIA